MRRIFRPQEAFMPPHQPNPAELGYYFSLAQVGLEMVVPIGLGVWLQDLYDFRPWGVVVGAVLGLTVGLTHLVVMTNRRDASGKGNQPRDRS
jgi:F0F1-type ATP synthase assembly protein I